MNDRELVGDVVRLSRKRGAEHADALLIRQEEKAASVFGQQVQLSGAGETARLTLRLFRDHKGAVISSHDFSERTLDSLVAGAFELMRQTSADKHLGSAEPSQVGGLGADLNIFDERLAGLPLDGLEQFTLAAGQAVSSRGVAGGRPVTANCQVQTQTVSLCTSEGFCDSYRATTATLSVNAVADGGTDEGGLDASRRSQSGAATVVSRSLEGLDVERAAVRATVALSAKDDARPALSGEAAVLLAPAAARVLASMLLQLCSGPATLFIEATTLGGAGEAICSPLVTLVDDATKEQGLGSAPFDHEGVKPERKTVIERGVLKDFLLNSYYARALQRRSTGNAIASPDPRFGVRPSNAYVEAGDASPEQIIADVKRGFLVTRFLSYSMALGANFAQAATGFWIEAGKVTHPVRAAAVVAPLQEMLKNVAAVGTDLDHHAAVASPSLLVSRMNVSPLM
jgi:PmbA protein